MVCQIHKSANKQPVMHNSEYILIPVPVPIPQKFKSLIQIPARSLLIFWEKASSYSDSDSKTKLSDFDSSSDSGFDSSTAKLLASRL